MTKTLKAILLLYFLNVSLALGQQSSQWLHFDIDNGLPTNNVYSTLIDNCGYLWMATDNGAVRYNGYRFDVFNTSKGLPSNDVYKLWEDRQGRMWVYSLSSEFGYIFNNKYQSLPLPRTDYTIYASDIVDFGKGILFTYGIYARGDNRIVFFDGKNLKHFDIARDQPVKYIYINTDDTTALVYTGKKDLCAIIKLSETQNFFKSLKGFVRPGFDFGSAILNNAIVWFKDSTLFFMNFKGEKVGYSKYNFAQQNSININDLDKGNSGLYSFTKVNDEYILFVKRYIYTFDKELLLKAKEVLPTFLPSQVAYRTVYKKFAWYATPVSGIWCNIAYDRPFSGHSDFVRLNNIPSSTFVGQAGKTTFWWDKNEDRLFNIAGQEVQQWHLPNLGVVKQVSINGKDSLLIVASRGIFLLNTNIGELKDFSAPFRNVTIYNWTFNTPNLYRYEHVTDKEKAMLFSKLFTLYKYSDNVFYALNAAGLLRYNIYERDSNKILVSLNQIGRFSHIRYDSLSRNLFIYNNKRLVLYSPLDSSLLELSKHNLSAIGLNNWNDIVVDQSGNVIFLLNDKIVCFNYIKSFSYLIEKNIDFTNAKITVNDHSLIAAGRFGVAVYKRKQNKYIKQRLHLNAKLQSYKEVYSIAIVDSKILLHTDNGLLAFYSDSILNYSSLNTREFFKLALREPVQKPVGEKNKIRLPQGTQRIALDLINFLGNGSPYFAYKIDELKSTWSESNNGEILLDNLSADKYYTIQIKAHDATWISDPISFQIYIEPYWWQRRNWITAFWMFGVLAIAGFVFIIVFTTRRIVSKKNEKRRVQTELELRAIHSQINPHFIFNTLSTALYFISKQQTKNAYEHVSQFSRLLRNYLRSSRERFITLADEVEILRQYIELQRARFSKAFQYEIYIAPEILPNHVLLPSLLLQPLVENAINHGLFNKGDSGFLKVHFYKGLSERELICIIDDNGIGRARAKEINKRYKKEKNSFGTALTRELIDIFRRYEQMDIHLQYIDKNEPETGTTVKLVISNTRVC